MTARSQPAGGAVAAGADWPNHEASRTVTAGGLRWHVQCLGAGPVVLLLHGTGAASHSWRDVAPLLAGEATVVIPDLPGHGFTTALPPRRMTLAGMARAVDALLDTLELAPEIVVGHSAGAALAIEMALDKAIAPHTIISFNGALLPYRESANPLFSAFARLFSLNPLVPRLFAWRAGRRGTVERLIRQTGSRIDAAGLAYYQRLLTRPAHCAAALHMMANWRLAPLVERIASLEARLELVVAEGDSAVPPSVGERIARRVSGAKVIRLSGLGHLAHEEDPQAAAEIIAAALRGEAGHAGGTDKSPVQE